MSGWTRRRSSGEIINATLLEVFLALSFMIFALAVFHKRRAEAAERRSLPLGALAVDSVLATSWRGKEPVAEDSLRYWRGLARANSNLRDSLAVFRRRIDSLTFHSPYPPDCEPNAKPREALTVTFAGPGVLRVRANRTLFGLGAGEMLTLSPAQFRARFAPVRALSIGRGGCRYHALVVDTPDMPKADYKVAMSAVTSVFRFRGAF